MENILIKEKMALAVDEAFFNIKKLVMEAIRKQLIKTFSIAILVRHLTPANNN